MQKIVIASVMVMGGASMWGSGVMVLILAELVWPIWQPGPSWLGQGGGGWWRQQSRRCASGKLDAVLFSYSYSWGGLESVPSKTHFTGRLGPDGFWKPFPYPGSWRYNILKKEIMNLAVKFPRINLNGRRANGKVFNFTDNQKNAN